MVDPLWQADAHLMGGTTYRDMAAHWPSSSEPFAAPMNEIPKVVLSRSLGGAEWGDSRVARGDPAEEIAALKREPGTQVLAKGAPGWRAPSPPAAWSTSTGWSSTPPPWAHACRSFAERMDLRLVDSRTFPAGAIALTYRPA